MTEVMDRYSAGANRAPFRREPTRQKPTKLRAATPRRHLLHGYRRSRSESTLAETRCRRTLCTFHREPMFPVQRRAVYRLSSCDSQPSLEVTVPRVPASRLAPPDRRPVTPPRPGLVPSPAAQSRPRRASRREAPRCPPRRGTAHTRLRMPRPGASGPTPPLTRRAADAGVEERSDDAAAAPPAVAAVVLRGIGRAVVHGTPGLEHHAVQSADQPLGVTCAASAPRLSSASTHRTPCFVARTLR